MNILKINASVSPQEASSSRQLVEEVISHIGTEGATITDRDLSKGVSLVHGALVGAYFTPEDQRTADQQTLLGESDALVEEVVNADAIVIGLPIYNFGVPGAMKAYFDLIARVGKTFKYTETGPVGLIADKPTYIVVASGGTALGSSMDFASGHIQLFLNFLGIQNIHTVDATGQMMDAEGSLARAKEQIAALPKVAAS